MPFHIPQPDDYLETIVLPKELVAMVVDYWQPPVLFATVLYISNMDVYTRSFRDFRLTPDPQTPHPSIAYFTVEFYRKKNLLFLADSEF